MSRYTVRLLSFLSVFFIVLFVLLSSFHNVCARTGYDEQEMIRRSAEQLKAFDEAQKEAARQRYDAKHRDMSGNDIGDIFGLSLIFIIIIFAALGVALIAGVKKEEAREAERARETEYKQKQKTLIDEWFAKATSLGFSIENETKECPACAETIKLKATICRYCHKEFTEEDIEKATIHKVDAFLTEKKPT